ncbi:transporter substrate-binding domain-containing protein [Rhizobium sp. G187]|uniref:transporter substrate-binding domain-containing protein n=1 Tax=Rhizobium sp. G187 TaxID=3451352 RepID=UPI003EE559F1
MRNVIGNFISLIAAGAISVFASGAAIAQTATQSLSKESVIETIKQEGVMKVGISMFKPWTMLDKNGELIGFEIDVARKLAKDMSVEVEFVPTAWDGIIPGLIAGNFDFIISGMTVTPQRNLTINFSDPYSFSGLTLFANIQRTKGFTEEDFNKPTVTFATVRGSVAETAVKELFPNAKQVLFDDSSVPPQELLNGNADAVIASEPLPSSEVRRYPETLYLPFPDKLFMPMGAGIALRKGDPDALNFLNNWVAVNTTSGWLKQRNDYWFKSEDWADQVQE